MCYGIAHHPWTYGVCVIEEFKKAMQVECCSGRDGPRIFDRGDHGSLRP
jgi:hypothetical protein